MLNSYYAAFEEPHSEEPIYYGYTFRAKDIASARLHAQEVAEQGGFSPVRFITRISHAQHVKLYSPFCIPTPLFEEDTND